MKGKGKIGLIAPGFTLDAIMAEEGRIPKNKQKTISKFIHRVTYLSRRIRYEFMGDAYTRIQLLDLLRQAMLADAKERFRDIDTYAQGQIRGYINIITAANRHLQPRLQRKDDRWPPLLCKSLLFLLYLMPFAIALFLGPRLKPTNVALFNPKS